MLDFVKNDKRYQSTILGTFVFGLLAHGFMLTNKISFHDDITSLHGLGGTWRSGRWSLGIIQYVLSNSIGKYSMPFWEVAISLLLIALSACLIVNLLDIKKEINCVMIGAIMAVFSVVAIIFTFMFTASCYFLALFLTIFAIWLTEKYKWGWIGGIACLSFSLGIYQAFFSVGITIVIFLLIKKCFEDDIHKLIMSILRLGVLEAGGILGYFAVVKLTLKLTHNTLAVYKGLDTMMSIMLMDRLKRIKHCYTDMIKILFMDVCGLTNDWIIRLLFVILLAVSAVLFIGLLFKVKNKFNRIIYVILVFITPIGINLIYPMTTKEEAVSAIVRYPWICIWIMAIFLVEMSNKYWTFPLWAIMKNTIVACSFLSIFYYAYIDNSAYTKIYFLQDQTTAYYTTLITQIKSSEGYKDELPVAYIGMGEIEDMTFTENTGYIVETALFGYDLKEWVNDFTALEYMSYHCGFTPLIMEEEEITNWDEIDNMPVYPDYGSIKTFDEYVVVKFAERE